jgi:hypothetical protein
MSDNQTDNDMAPLLRVRMEYPEALSSFSDKSFHLECSIQKSVGIPAVSN